MRAVPTRPPRIYSSIGRSCRGRSTSCVRRGVVRGLSLDCHTCLVLPPARGSAITSHGDAGVWSFRPSSCIPVAPQPSPLSHGSAHARPSQRRDTARCCRTHPWGSQWPDQERLARRRPRCPDICTRPSTRRVTRSHLQAVRWTRSAWGGQRLVDGLQVVKWPMPYIDQRPNHAGRHIRTRIEPAADRLHACLDRISDGANLDDPVIRSSATARKRQLPRFNLLFEKAV